MKKQIEFYRVSVDRALGVEGLLRKLDVPIGHHDPARLIADPRFSPPIRQAEGTYRTEVGLLPLEGDRKFWGSAEICRQIIVAGVGLAHPEETLALGAQYPGLQLSSDILSIGAFWVSLEDMKPRLLYLFSTTARRGKKRGAQLLADSREADHGTCVAVVRRPFHD